MECVHVRESECVSMWVSVIVCVCVCVYLNMKMVSTSGFCLKDSGEKHLQALPRLRKIWVQILPVAYWAGDLVLWILVLPSVKCGQYQ